MTDPPDASPPVGQRGWFAPQFGSGSPLWIIALFISLTEFVTAGALVWTSGWVQGVLLFFVVLFPTYVFTAFLGFLWYKPHVLYPPSAFEGKTTVTVFTKAMLTQKAEIKGKAEIKEIPPGSPGFGEPK